MRIIEMRPEVTPFKDGQSRKASSWSFHDHYVPIGGHVRSIYHYNTHMLDYVGYVREQRCIDADRGEYEDVIEWHAEPVSVGWGSVSDQNGMNLLLSKRYIYDYGMYDDYGYYYARDQRGGGPRIENTHTKEVEVD